MTTAAIEEIHVPYTFTAIPEALKQELAPIQMDVNEYRNQIREHKKNRLPTQYYYDYMQELDFSIDTEDFEDVRRKIYDDRLYYYKAHHYLKIGLFQKQDVPVFKVKISDLSQAMIYELSQLEEKDRKFVLKQAVARIFEDINYALYHDSISCNLEVILVK